MSAPYVMLPLLAVAAMVAWWVRGKMSQETITCQRERIALLNDRLKFAADKAASANEAKEEVEEHVQAYSAVGVALDAAEVPLALRVGETRTDKRWNLWSKLKRHLN